VGLLLQERLGRSRWIRRRYFLRTLALPDEVAQWSLTTLQEKLVPESCATAATPSSRWR
jgi:hypothetical protein